MAMLMLATHRCQTQALRFPGRRTDFSRAYARSSYARPAWSARPSCSNRQRSWTSIGTCGHASTAYCSHRRAAADPVPRVPSRELVAAIVEMKRRNPRWGCPRIARQIGLAFEVPIDKDVVRRVLATRYRPESNSNGPSWLTFLGHAKDSLWSIDLFRCESATLRSHWVLVVMGPVHATDRRLRHPLRRCGWPGPVLHVQPCHSRASDAEIPQRRQRSPVPVLPVARQLARATHDRGQECPVRAAVASVCRTPDRHPTARMPRSDAVLVCAGPGGETDRLPGLLQRASGACGAGRSDASPDTEGRSHGSTTTGGKSTLAGSIRRRSQPDV